MQAKADISSQTLPRWMRESRRGVDWGVLLAIVFSAAVAWAFLLQPGLPRTNATENYVFRTDDYAQTLLEGRFYPRWSPNVFSGYGSPVPNYFPPAAPYTAALIQIFLTDNAVDAVRVLYAISLTLAGTMVYALVTRRANASSGLMAALLYVYSPYVGMIAPHVIGDLPGVVSMALIPALLWALDRLVVLYRAQDVALVVFLTSALVLTDLRYAAIGLILALLFVIWHGISTRNFSRLLLVLGAFLVGLLLASFYWFPAILESTAVHWRPSIITPINLQLSVPQIIMPMQQIDLAELTITPHLTLGVPSTLFALLGMATFIIYRKWVGFHIFFLTLGSILLVVLLTAFPNEVWLLGIVMLCLSIGASGFITLRERLLPRLLLPVSIIIILATSSAVWLSPLWSPDFGDVSPAAQVDYERQGFGIAILPAGVPIPSTIDDTLLPNRFLLEGYQFGNISKILPEQITPTTQVGTLAHFTHADSIQITTTVPTPLEILTAYFPGWTAILDGVYLPVTPDPANGLIQVSLPETRNSELTIVFGTTPIRQTAWAISGCAFVTVILISWFRMRQPNRIYNDLVLLTVEEARLTGVVMASFLVVIVFFAFPASPVSLRAPEGHGLDGTITLSTFSDGGLQAIAYELSNNVYHHGDPINFSVFWRNQRPVQGNYQVKAYLSNLDDPSVRWYETPLHNPGAYLTRRWIPNRYVREDYTFTLSTGIPYGNYVIAFEVYACNPFCLQNTRANFFDNSGNLLGQVMTLPTIITIAP